MSQLETLWTSRLSDVDGQAYDSFVAQARGGHYSQTRAWAKVMAAGKPFAPIFFLARRNGAVIGAALMLRTRIGLPLPFAQSERGPVCDDPDDLPLVVEALRRETLRHGVLRLSVMPYWAEDTKPRVEADLEQLGFVDCQRPSGRHARTLRLDLAALPDDEPFSSAALAKVRRELRRAERAGGVARYGRRDDMAAFRQMHDALQQREGKSPPSAAWYGALADYFLSDKQRGAMFVGEYEGRVVSAIFITRHGSLSTYILGASTAEVLHFPKMIQPMAMAIVRARRTGAELFDFGGIPMADNADAKRASIAEFKYSFSRDEVALVHEHIRWF